jgi:hypothetical protein
MSRPAPTGPSPASRTAPALSLWLVAAPLVMLLLAVAFLLSSGGLEGREAAYPRVLAVVVIALAAVSIVQDLTSGRQVFAAGPAQAPASALDDAAEDDLEGRRGQGLAARRVVVFFVIAVVSVWLMSWVGFFLPAFLLVGAGVYVLGVRTPWKVAAYTGGLVAAAYAVFVEALQVPFPAAPWS